MKLLVFACVACIVFICGLQSATATDYPRKNISVIVPYGAGGGTDTQARLFLSFVEKTIGKPVIIVNKPGARGEIGNTAIFNAKPEGYMLGVLAYPDSTALEVYKEVKYNASEFIYIASYTKSPVVLIAKKDGPLKDLEGFIAYAKKNPGKITVSMAADSHTLATVFLQNEAGIKVTPVFYKSGSKALNGLLGGHVDAAMIATQFGVVAESQGFPVIGVAGDERVPKLPNSPTFKEKGYNLKVMQSRILVAPKGTPEDVVKVLTEACNKAAEEKELRAKIENLGEVYHFLSEDALVSYVNDTNAQVTKAVKENKGNFLRKKK